MQLSGQSDAWKSFAHTIQFSIPSCVGYLSSLVPTNARILEIGCGYGRISRDLRNHGFTDVTGYDSSPSMIERGHREHPDLTLRLNFGTDLPESDGSADAVVCCAVLTCIPDMMARERVLGEVERVLRPGGVVHVVEFAEGGSRSYDASGRFMSGFGIEMVHFSRQRLLTELGRFQDVGIREFDCRSVSGRPEKAFVFQGKKRANQALEPTAPSGRGSS